MSSSLPVPSTFGRYELQQHIGEGGMGTVYLALDRQLDRRVALKIPHFKSKEPKTIIDRFYREARVAARIEHPNICRVYDVGECNGNHYLTMEFIEGTSLSKMLSAEHPWPLFNAAALVRKIALAVHILHENKVIHRDLKPSNILLRPSGEPVLMDFGLARSVSPDGERFTAEGEFMGTPAYMSPEQANADSTVELGPPTDIYSLGVILYEMVTGQLPFKGNTTQILVQLVTNLARPPSNLRKELPAAFDDVCLKALSKRPEERYVSAQAFAEALLPFLIPSTTRVGGMATIAGGTVADSPLPFVMPVTQPPPHVAATLHTGLVNSSAPTTSGIQQSATLPPPPQPAGLPELPRPRGLPAIVGMMSMVFLLAIVWTWSIRWSLGYLAATEETSQLTPTFVATKTTDTRNSVGMELVLIERGRFQMGTPNSPPNSDERDHTVVLTESFYMGAYEVTQEEYERVIGHNRAVFPSLTAGNAKYPVHSVTWDEAVLFCEKLSALPTEQQAGRKYRLPTEAEWEYACRAHSTTLWHCPESELSASAWTATNSENQAHPVGQKKANAFGLHDMHGNVWEWCSDWYKEYPENPLLVNPLGPERSDLNRRVLRGGGWKSSAADCRSARRFADDPKVRDSLIGFRVVAYRTR